MRARYPAEWAAAARQHGGVVILAGDIGLDDADSAQEFGDAMTVAIAAGRVACGLAAITTAKGVATGSGGPGHRLDWID
jgi:hypothetical protein